MTISLDEIKSKAPKGATHYSGILCKCIKIEMNKIWINDGNMWKIYQTIKHPRQLARLQVKPL